MKQQLYTAALLFLFVSMVSAQENVFLNREYWKANPSIATIEADIAAGNDIAELNSSFFDAVCFALMEKTDNATIKYLLSKPKNTVNKLTHDGRTYIFWAAYRNNLEIMEYLVSHGAKANIQDAHGYSALNFAAVTGQTNTKIYDFLLAHKAAIKDTTRNGANALLLIAPFATDFSILNYFINKGLDIKSTDNVGNGIFNYAAKGGNIPLLKSLVTKGIPYKTLNKEGGNAMLLASEGMRRKPNNLATYTYLDSLGIKANITNNKGQNPLHAIASHSDDLAIFKFFIEKGVAINQQDEDGKSPFINAASRNKLPVVKFLSNYITDINTKDANGRTALTMAVHRNSAAVVDFLLQKGSNINVKDAKENTLAYYLLKTYNANKPEVFEAKLQLLQNKGLNLNETQNKKNTLYHIAVEQQNLPLLKRLKSFDIDINAKNSEGNTALHIAAMQSKDNAILKYLISEGADKNIKTEFKESVLNLAMENEQLKQNNVELNFLK